MLEDQGHANRVEQGAPSSSRRTCTASNEVPPRSRKFSWTPTSSCSRWGHHTSLIVSLISASSPPRPVGASPRPARRDIGLPVPRKRKHGRPVRSPCEGADRELTFAGSMALGSVRVSSARVASTLTVLPSIVTTWATSSQRAVGSLTGHDNRLRNVGLAPRVPRSISCQVRSGARSPSPADRRAPGTRVGRRSATGPGRRCDTSAPLVCRTDRAGTPLRSSSGLPKVPHVPRRARRSTDRPG